MQHSRLGRCPVLCGVLVRGSACLRTCFGPLVVKVVKDGLEEGEFGRKFGEFGGDAVYDVSDGSTVGVDGVILLLW